MSKDNATQPLPYGEAVDPCPCCGRTQLTDPTSSVAFDYWRGLIYTTETEIWLGSDEADLLKILLEAWPDLSTRSFLQSRLYGVKAADKVKQSPRTVNHTLSRLRRKIRPLGLDIPNLPGRGWRISNAETAPSEVSNSKSR